MREVWEQVLREQGAIIQRSVSKNTDLLIVGKNPSPAKIAKAQKLGVKIVYIK